MSTAAAPASFSPQLVPEDELARHWLRQVTLRLRREVLWMWHQRGQGTRGRRNALPPATDPTVEALDLARYWEDKQRFFAHDQTARYLGRLDNGPSSVSVGAFALLRDPKEVGTAVDVVDPKGERVLSLAEATKAQNIQFVQAGFYDIRRPNGRNELVAVNADRHESDLTPAPPEILTLWQNTANGTSATEAGTATGEQKPLSLWWYVMLAVLALTIVESFLGNQHLSVDKEAA